MSKKLKRYNVKCKCGKMTSVFALSQEAANSSLACEFVRCATCMREEQQRKRK